ncbi:hypothetical protein ABK040_005836 [Willaertia magna]
MSILPNDHHFPTNLSHLDVLESLVGSSKPEKVKDRNTNHTFVMKKGFNTQHVINEYRVNLCYYQMGCKVPKSKLYRNGTALNYEQLDTINENDQVVVLSEFIDSATTWKQFQETHNKDECNQIRELIAKHFVLDCLLANRDVIGSDDCNIIIVKHNNQFIPYRIDNGGALSYRAQGKLKDLGEWSGFVSEINTMTDESFNSNTGNMFGKVINFEKIIEQVMEINDKVENCIYPYLTKEDKEIVKERLSYLQSVAIGYSQNQTYEKTNDTITVNQELLEQLIMMGFSKKQAENALIASNNNIEAAMNYLFD